MRRLIISIVLILLSINLCIAQKSGFSSNFTSGQQIRNYFASNISLLDPIEGEYDVEFSGEYITPLVHQYLDRANFKIWILCNNGTFTIYGDDGGFQKSDLLKIQSLGETNAYTFYYDSTPTRIFLQGLFHFKASLHLNNSSANTFRGATSTAPSVNIFPVFDCIKVYPTMSMYSNSNGDVNSLDKIYNYPSVSNRYDKSLTLVSVVIKSNETVLTISCKNDLLGGWMNIDRNAYIVANGNQYTLIRTEGIAYSPSYTYFSYRGESKTFKLHFQAIPKNTNSIDFIENATSQWRLYGISLKK